MVTNDEFREAFGLARQDGGWSRAGKVVSLSSDGGLMVSLDGSASGTRCEKWCAASVGDVVLVEGVGRRALATAVLGGGTGGDTGWTDVYVDSDDSGSIEVVCRRKSGWVSVVGWSRGYFDVGGGSYKAVTTLPEGFRPSRQTWFCYDFMGGEPAGKAAYVGTDGTVNMYAAGSESRAYWDFDVSFPVDGGGAADSPAPSGGGYEYYAGRGLTLTGRTFDADVDASDLAAVEAKADAVGAIPTSWVEAL